MRYTETKLDKLIRIHHGMVDNIVNQACDDLEAIKPKPKSWLTLSATGDLFNAAYESMYGNGKVWNPLAQGRLMRGDGSWV